MRDKFGDAKMGINWKEVEKLIRPVPNYETLVKRLLDVFSYNFVRKNYNHSFVEARRYSSWLLECDPKQRYKEYLKKIKETFRQLDKINIKDYLGFIHQTETREKLEKFCERTSLGVENVIRLLKYLLFWVLPTKIYLRELIDKESKEQSEFIKTLREHDIRFTLDILEMGKTRAGRDKITKETGIPTDFIYELVNRADFTRMPYVSKKTVKHYFNIGINNLEKLANSDLNKLTANMAKYLRSKGIKLSRSFIELDSGIAIAGVLPMIVEH